MKLFVGQRSFQENSNQEPEVNATLPFVNHISPASGLSHCRVAVAVWGWLSWLWVSPLRHTREGHFSVHYVDEVSTLKYVKEVHTTDPISVKKMK